MIARYAWARYSAGVDSGPRVVASCRPARQPTAACWCSSETGTWVGRVRRTWRAPHRPARWRSWRCPAAAGTYHHMPRSIWSAGKKLVRSVIRAIGCWLSATMNGWWGSSSCRICLTLANASIVMSPRAMPSSSSHASSGGVVAQQTNAPAERVPVAVERVGQWYHRQQPSNLAACVSSRTSLPTRHWAACRGRRRTAL